MLNHKLYSINDKSCDAKYVTLDNFSIYFNDQLYIPGHIWYPSKIKAWFFYLVNLSQKGLFLLTP